jgi:hypothetical protein
MVKFEKQNNQDYGKIITKEEIGKQDYKNNEIYRSIEYSNGNKLFVLDLKPNENSLYVQNSLQLLITTKTEARAIDKVYQNMFTWVFDGVSIKGYAIVPSSDMNANSTISRYGGTDTFIKILRQHLKNIGKLFKGQSPNYNFKSTETHVETEELCIGSLNSRTNAHSIVISLEDDYKTIYTNSKKNIHKDYSLKVLDMKYWAKQINPDFISDATHIRLQESASIELAYKFYPPCIKALIALPNKGNMNRFRLSKFLLNVHNIDDAKHIYDSTMSEKERDHIKHGNCSTQWRYILNNIKRYDCPTCWNMRDVCDSSCKFVHPLEPIQLELNRVKETKKGE